MPIYDLIEYIKNNTDKKSDYAICKSLGISTSKMSDWKRLGGNADGPTTLRLTKLSGLSAGEALDIIEGKTAEAAFRVRESFLMNIRVSEYKNPRKINYLHKIENLKATGRIYIIRNLI